jgi:hypothetical protein
VGIVSPRALIFPLVALASVALAQQDNPIFPSNLAQTTPFNTRETMLARAAFDPATTYPESVTLVGNISPKLFAGVEEGWRNLFGYSYFPDVVLDRYFQRPVLIVGRSSVPGLRHVCQTARFALYSVDRVPGQAMMVIDRRELQAVKHELWLGGMLDGSGSSILLYEDEAFINNVVIQLNLPAMIARAKREC